VETKNTSNLDVGGKCGRLQVETNNDFQEIPQKPKMNSKRVSESASKWVPSTCEIAVAHPTKGMDG